MTSLTMLWLPVLLSAVFVFIVSSIIHMALPWHKGDYRKLPDEDKFSAAVRPLAIPPGDYMVPRPGSMQEMRTPEFTDKWKKGPVLVMTVMPSGPMAIASNMAQWFIYLVVVSFFSAYVASRALAPGADYLQVFRFAGTAAFLSYSMGMWPPSIWYRRSWGTTIRFTIDGLIFGLLTGGTFGWLWPK